MSDEQLVLAETDGHVAVLTLNRPKALNALNPALIEELVAHLDRCEADDQIRVIVLTGGARAFAAGADIKAMVEASPSAMLLGRSIERWSRIAAVRKPMIAAVSGYAFGGGCEVALMCDMIVASETAQFGLPEINLGIMPGAGGTQRLTRAVGPQRAMEMILTGAPISAREAYQFGLVNRVAPVETFLAEAMTLAHTVAAKAPIAAMLAKEAIRAAAETTLREGFGVELRNFYLLFDTEDQKEGMRAFVAKRKAEFQGR
jgi:enoyl-CoA hydratase